MANNRDKGTPSVSEDSANAAQGRVEPTNQRGGSQIEGTLKARFSTRLVVSKIAMISNNVASTAPLVERNEVPKRVPDELVQRVQDTKGSFMRILELSKQLNDLLSRPLPWIPGNKRQSS
jgi:hypothetical protein